jgi:threonylcarbamoyladenosine tRNA methylthiotransferase MtaB
MAEKKKIAFYTLGCKLNFSETSQISRQFPADIFEITDFNDLADIYVINTCVVTEKAEKKSRAAIRQAKKRNPYAFIAAIGCYSEINPDELLSLHAADVVLGTSEKFAISDYLKNGTFEKLAEISDNYSGNKYISSYSANDRTRSFFKIQDGCDYFCAYCTVPLARGRSRSDTIAGTVGIAKEIARSGIKEIILTGVNVGDFGRKNNEHFIDLLKELEAKVDVERIRISSIEPDLLSKDIIEFVAGSKKFLPHFHIPLQSASNKILKAMKRRYDVELFTEKVNHIKALMPDCCIAVDIITGFPGETDTNFEEGFNYLSASPISVLHVFTYSERENTQAIKMEGTVQHEIRKKRSHKLLALSSHKKTSFYKEHIAKEKFVLFESDNDQGMMHGFTENYIKVKTSFDAALINQVKKVRLERIEKDGIFAVNFIE